MRTIALINQKGGVGKTTTAVNLAANLAARGLDVAAIDMDPQSHLTIHFGLNPGDSKVSMYEVLTETAALTDAAVSVSDHLRVVPASIDLAGAEIELASVVGREQLLADRLAAASLGCEYVFIDCAPSLGLLTLNALAAADEIIIPLQPHFLALQGLGELLQTVTLVRRRINPRLRVCGVVLCMFESNTRLAAEVTDDVASFLSDQADPQSPWAGARLFETRIRRNVKLAECPSFGQTIFHYAPTCHGAEDYGHLADELLAIHERGATDPATENTQAEAAADAESASAASPSPSPAPVEPVPSVEPSVPPAVEP